MQNIKITLLSFTIGFFAYSLSAQDGILLGVDGSYLINTIINQNNLGQNLMDYEDPALQFAFGAHAGYKIDHRHQVRIGVLAYEGGQSYEEKFSFGRLNKTVSMNYIGIPISYRFTTGKEENDNSGVKFYLEGGPMISFLTSGSMYYAINKQETDFNSFYLLGGNANESFIRAQSLTSEEAHDPETFFTSTDFLFTASIGIQAYLSEHFILSFGANGVISIFDINRSEWQINNVDGEYISSRNAHAGFTLSLSYLF